MATILLMIIGRSAVTISSGSLFTFSGIAISLFGCMNRTASSPSTNSTWSIPAPNREYLPPGFGQFRVPTRISPVQSLGVIAAIPMLRGVVTLCPTDN
ncbi:hypothetical protein E4T56_gene7571 [Termitomyces sp. T112]|nr:hypothetical protein E4T56_gene7571 [Termitomyces sp. T112]